MGILDRIYRHDGAMIDDVDGEVKEFEYLEYYIYTDEVYILGIKISLLISLKL
jgi:hypothetical protein